MSTDEPLKEWEDKPELSKIENSFWAALRRLELKRPSNPDLVEAAEAGRLRISFTTVAAEAGHARGLIGTEGCAYPDVRKAILIHKRGPGNTLMAEVQRLRDRVAELELQVAARDSTHAELLLRVRALMKGTTPTGAPLSGGTPSDRRKAFQVVEAVRNATDSDSEA